MTITRMLNALLLVAALFAGGAHAAGNPITIASEDGRPVAQFTVGDSNCVLKDDQIQCTPAGR